jgi:hypothetical protein
MSTRQRIWKLGKGSLAAMKENIKLGIILSIMFVLLCGCVAVTVYT